MPKWITLTAAGLFAGGGVAGAGPFDLRRPDVFVHAADQQRARLLRKPCSKADLGRGCYRERNGFLVREAPCVYHIDAVTNGSIPTDQCFKMQKQQRFHGIWIDGFEGQEFIPDGIVLPTWPSGKADAPRWNAKAERVRLAHTWLDVGRVSVHHDFSGRKVRIEFVGRKTRYPGAYGHMGMFGNEIIVDRVISLKPLS